MGVKVAIGVVSYVLVAGGVSFFLWDFLHAGASFPSVTIRNLVLIWGAPLYSDEQSKREIQGLLSLYESEPMLRTDGTANEIHGEMVRAAVTISYEEVAQGKPADRWWRRLFLRGVTG